MKVWQFSIRTFRSSFCCRTWTIWSSNARFFSTWGTTEEQEEKKKKVCDCLQRKFQISVSSSFSPEPPSAAASCFAPELVDSSSRWQTPETPAQTPRMHLGCREPAGRERVLWLFFSFQSVLFLTWI